MKAASSFRRSSAGMQILLSLFASSMWLHAVVVAAGFSTTSTTTTQRRRASLKHPFMSSSKTCCTHQPLSSTTASTTSFTFRNNYMYNQRGGGGGGGGGGGHQFRSSSTPSSITRMQLVCGAGRIIDGDNEVEKNNSKNKRKKILVTLWIHVMSAFVVANYFIKTTACWPPILMRLPLKGWNLIHGLSAMTFAGSILTTTVLEWNLFSSKNFNKNSKSSSGGSGLGGGRSLDIIVNNLFRIETLLVLPALTGSMISGVAQSFHSYGSLRYAPRHVKMSLHILLTFGLWWGITDRRTQGKLEEAADNNDFEANVWQQRRWSNVGSCLFLIGLYCVMILKPGYAG